MSTPHPSSGRSCSNGGRTECYVTDQAPEAIDALERAIEHYRAVGDAPKEGVALAMLARRVYGVAVSASRKRIVHDAISILEGIPGES